IIPNPNMPILAHKFVIFNLKSRTRPAALWSRQERACFPAHNTATADSERANRFNILCAVLILFPASDGVRCLFVGCLRFACRLGWCRGVIGLHHATALLNHLFKVIPADTILTTEQFARAVLACPVAV